MSGPLNSRMVCENLGLISASVSPWNALDFTSVHWWWRFCGTINGYPQHPFNCYPPLLATLISSPRVFMKLFLKLSTPAHFSLTIQQWIMGRCVDFILHSIKVVASAEHTCTRHKHSKLGDSCTSKNLHVGHRENKTVSSPTQAPGTLTYTVCLLSQ